MYLRPGKEGEELKIPALSASGTVDLDLDPHGVLAVQGLANITCVTLDSIAAMYCKMSVYILSGNILCNFIRQNDRKHKMKTN